MSSCEQHFYDEVQACKWS